MTEKKGQVNQYFCQKCTKPITTINKDEGTTPFAIHCHATEGCEGPMHSMLYKVPRVLVEQVLVPDYEWRHEISAEAKEEIQRCVDQIYKDGPPVIDGIEALAKEKMINIMMSSVQDHFDRGGLFLFKSEREEEEITLPDEFVAFLESHSLTESSDLMLCWNAAVLACSDWVTECEIMDFGLHGLFTIPDERIDDE